MIDFVNITKCFDGKTVLDGVSFSVKTGGVFGLVGTNGAGKSTLMKILSGVYQADAGVMEVAYIFLTAAKFLLTGRLFSIPLRQKKKSFL